MPHSGTKPRLSRETRAAILAAVAVVVLVGGSAAVALSWKAIAARYWVRRLVRGDDRAPAKLKALGESAVGPLLALVRERDPVGLDWGICRTIPEQGYHCLHTKASRILAAIGGPAEHALLAEIDRAQDDSARRARLYAALRHFRTRPALRAVGRAVCDEPPEIRKAVYAGCGSMTEASFEWLAGWQEEDGHWDAARWGAAGEDAASDLEVTALAASAFVSVGYTHRTGGWREYVASALEWLKSRQREDGRIGTGSMREHTVASLALGRAYSMTRDPGLLGPVRRAADWTVAHQHASGGWAAQPGGAPDAFTTALCVCEIKSAKLEKIKVPDKALQAATGFLDGLIAAEGKDENLVRPRPGEAPTLRATAAAMFALNVMNPSRDDPRLRRLWAGLAGRVDEALPDPWTAYLGAWAAHTADARTWRKWGDAMSAALTRSMQEHSLWPLDSAEAKRLGRAGTTALRARASEVYFSYPPMDY